MSQTVANRNKQSIDMPSQLLSAGKRGVIAGRAATNDRSNRGSAVDRRSIYMPDEFVDFDNRDHLGDVLDLRGLSTMVDAGNLGDYLHFSLDGCDTLIEISSVGGFAGGYRAGAADHVIRINGLDLTSGLSTNEQIIAELRRRGKILINSVV